MKKSILSPQEGTNEINREPMYSSLEIVDHRCLKVKFGPGRSYFKAKNPRLAVLSKWSRVQPKGLNRTKHKTKRMRLATTTTTRTSSSSASNRLLQQSQQSVLLLQLLRNRYLPLPHHPHHKQHHLLSTASKRLLASSSSSSWFVTSEEKKKKKKKKKNPLRLSTNTLTPISTTPFLSSELLSQHRRFFMASESESTSTSTASSSPQTFDCWHPLTDKYEELRLSVTLPSGQSFRWKQIGFPHHLLPSITSKVWMSVIRTHLVYLLQDEQQRKGVFFYYRPEDHNQR